MRSCVKSWGNITIARIPANGKCRYDSQYSHIPKKKACCVYPSFRKYQAIFAYTLKRGTYFGGIGWKMLNWCDREDCRSALKPSLRTRNFPIYPRYPKYTRHIQSTPNLHPKSPRIQGFVKTKDEGEKKCEVKRWGNERG